MAMRSRGPSRPRGPYPVLDEAPANNLRVAIGHQREVGVLMWDCDAETGRFRFADEDARVAVLEAAGRLWDALDRLIDDLGMRT